MNAITFSTPEHLNTLNHPLLDQVGNTPLLPLRRIGADLPAAVRLWGKAEFRNPTGSVKDRPAAAILTAALTAGELEDGRTLLDSTSGNMGIAYAAFGAVLGVPVHLAVPSNASAARLSMLRALGAVLTLTDPLEGSDGARVIATEMAERDGGQRYFFADQYSNPNNWRAHYRTTGPELVEQTDGQLTHVVAGMGTSGTLVGVGRFLADQELPVERVAVQPAGPLHGLEGLKHYD
ncbi:MAG: pyridoxal-phosphate dependent enzyme, partial [Anaerolineales bacterium]